MDRRYLMNYIMENNLLQNDDLNAKILSFVLKAILKNWIIVFQLFRTSFAKLKKSGKNQVEQVQYLKKEIKFG